MNLGIQNILGVNLGGASISKVYLGATLIWSGTVSYTAQVDPGVTGTKVFSDITGWTPDNPFIYPTASGGPLQTQDASDISPISIVATYNSNGKSASVILLKNNVVQQAIAVNNVPTPRAFNPLPIADGDVVKVQGN